jgi:hypothetical protein
MPLEVAPDIKIGTAMTKIFYIMEDISKTSLMEMADRFGIKVHIVRISTTNKWQIITSGAESSVQTFYDSIKETKTKMKNYNGIEPNYDEYYRWFYLRESPLFELRSVFAWMRLLFLQYLGIVL